MRPALGALAALALAGCAGGPLEPRYQRPASPVPAALPSGGAYGEQPANAAPAPWQGVFAGGKLRAVIELTLAQNRDLRVAVAQAQAAQAQYRTQRAALLPKIDANAGVTKGREFTGVLPSEGPAYENASEFSADVAVTSWEIDLFGRLRSLTKAARETYLATDAARSAEQITVIAQVATDWLTLAADRSALAVAQTTLQSGQQSLDLAQQRLSGGVGTALDVANAKTVVEQAKADIGRYTTLVAQDRDGLDLAAGTRVPDDLLPSGEDDPDASLPTVPGALSSSVLLRRPDVAEAEHQLRSANADIGAARAAFFPQIQLTAQGGSATLSLGSLFAPGSTVWSFAPTITVPIFHGGANLAGLAYARAEDRIAVAQYEKAIQTAFRETADALADRGTIQARLDAQQGLVDAAAESLRLSTALYERGADSYLDVLTAQRTLYAAQQGMVTIRLTAANNIVTLYKVLGGGIAP
jgi:multidrug efflux system outer membrane protein